MFEEIKFKYKALLLQKRLILVFLLAIIPGLVNYLEQSGPVKEALDNAINQETTERSTLALLKDQVKNLGALEKKLEDTRSQLTKAETLLPSSLNLDSIVQKMAETAKDNKIKLTYIQPKGVTTIAGDYPYDEVKFNVQGEGTFGQIGSWMDDISVRDAKAYVKAWEVSRATNKSNSTESASVRRTTQAQFGREVSVQEKEALEKQEKNERAAKLREDVKVKLNLDVVYYKTASMGRLEDSGPVGQSVPGAPPVGPGAPPGGPVGPGDPGVRQ